MDGKQQKDSRQPKGHTKRKVWLILAIIAAVLVMICVGVYVYVDSLVNVGDSGSLTDEVVSTEPEISKKTINILVAGIDYAKDDSGRDYSDGKGMTDVVLLVCCDLEKNTMHLLQIPRDSYVGEAVDTGGTGKLNAVYSHGSDAKNPITNLAKVINDQFKLPVDYYVTLDMDAFTSLINILGGVEMYVPWQVERFDDNGNLIDTLEPGTHFISGETAQWIVQTRHGTGYGQADLKRLEMQQYFYTAVFKTFLTFPMSDLIKVAPSLAQYVNTDFSVPELIYLFGWLQKVDKSNIGFARCPGGSISNVAGHQSMYGINPQSLAELLNKYFRPYSNPVDASELGLVTGLEFPLGEIPATMTYMDDLSAEADSSSASSAPAA